MTARATQTTSANIKFTEEAPKKGDVIALGDVHASWDLYSQFLAWVKDSGAVVVLLGDLIDRGEDDLIVLETTKRILDDPASWGLESFYVLKGNHEKMFIDSVESEMAQEISLWLYNGGNLKAIDEMEEKHYPWLKNLPLYMTIGDTLFVHAGLVPGENPAETVDSGNGEELVWIRSPFIRNGPKLEKWTDTVKKVVHGHTITFKGEKANQPVPVMKGDRVNIDTGAFLKEGCLTAYNVTQGSFTQFNRPATNAKIKSPRKTSRR